MKTKVMTLTSIEENKFLTCDWHQLIFDGEEKTLAHFFIDKPEITIKGNTAHSEKFTCKDFILNEDYLGVFDDADNCIDVKQLN